MADMELLAPAGGMRELRAAVQSGADAVYLGASEFSARAGAGNFSRDELREAVEYCHIYGVKVHCALNTLIKENELEAAADTARMIYDCGADAIIIQDIGLAAYLSRIMPELELHASTQMTVTSLEGVRYLEEHGFSRVVLARELSLSEINEIAKGARAELEVFVHGAICMCYSGQCLMSSVLGGRSGNRGRCAQPCRLPYALMRGGKKEAEAYLLSPKDMSLIEHLPELKRLGIASLKIEGRLKSAEYVSAVTGVYRKYLDSPAKVNDKDKRELLDAFSRSGFTDGYLTGKPGRAMMSHDVPANTAGCVYTPEAKQRADGKTVRKIPVSIFAELKKDDVLRVTAYDDEGFCVTCCGGVRSEPAKNTAMSRERLTEQLKKLGDTPFEAADINAELDGGITIPVKEINSVRRSVCAELAAERAKRDRKKIKDIPLSFGGAAEEREIYLTAEVESAEQGLAVIKEGGIKRIYAPPSVAAELLKCSNGIEIVTRTADIFRAEQIPTEFVSVSSPAALRFYGSRAKYGDMRLNVFNSLTAAALTGLSCVTLSPELNLHEIREITEHIGNKETEIICYGRLPLMLMRNCPAAAAGFCQAGRELYSLRDRKGMNFPVICRDRETGTCRAELLNSKPVFAADIIDELKGLKINCIRLKFTVENSAQCGKIVGVYKNALNGIKPEMPETNTFTRGHLKRGVK